MIDVQPLFFFLAMCYIQFLVLSRRLVGSRDIL